MQQKFFVKPFAVAGDRDAVPNDIQTTGDVSYEQGYGYDYQRDQATDPLAKPIERNKHNALLHDITEAVQQYQVFGTPEWITADNNGGIAYTYARRARVRYRAKDTDPWDVYESLVDNNAAEPSDATQWALIASVVASQEQAIAGTDNNTVMTPLRVAQAIAASSNSVGQIVFEARTSARAGYLKCNGALLNRADYPALWAYAQAGGALVSDVDWKNNNWGNFSDGDGTTTFRIPELRGEHLRCWDDGRGVDDGRKIGSWQDSQNRSHAHGASTNEAGDHTHSGRTDEQGLHAHHGLTAAVGDHQHVSPWGENSAMYSPPWGTWGGNNNVGSKGWIDYDNIFGLTSPAGNHNHEFNTDGAGNHGHNVSIDGSGIHVHDVTIATDGGNETRPRNVALLAMIRY